METDIIYWRHHTLPGIKVEEICGATDKPMKLWFEMAYQVYGENGKDAYREIGHFTNGAPFLIGESSRISVSHANHFLVIATLSPTPDIDLSCYSELGALGVDTEKADRQQVLKIRSKFLSSEESGKVAPDDIKANIIAWTCKEAIYKAALSPGLDFTKDIIIEKLPEIGPATPVYKPSEFGAIEYGYGHAIVNGDKKEFILYSYESEGHIVTLAYSAQSAVFGK